LIASSLSTQIILPHSTSTGSIPLHAPHPKPTIPLPSASPSLVLTHLFGGFSINRPDRVMQAASEGINFTIDYGDPPSSTSAIGGQLLLSHMKVIDGFISSNLFYYECHKSKSIPNPSPAIASYCQSD